MQMNAHTLTHAVKVSFQSNGFFTKGPPLDPRQEKRYMEMPRDWEEKINREKINAGSLKPLLKQIRCPKLDSNWLPKDGYGSKKKMDINDIKDILYPSYGSSVIMCYPRITNWPATSSICGLASDPACGAPDGLRQGTWHACDPSGDTECSFSARINKAILRHTETKNIDLKSTPWHAPHAISHLRHTNSLWVMTKCAGCAPTVRLFHVHLTEGRPFVLGFVV